MESSLLYIKVKGFVIPVCFYSSSAFIVVRMLNKVWLIRVGGVNE